MSASNSQQRIGIINALRGFAALVVAWGHFVAGQGKYLGMSGKYGYLGVDIFFVISGFVIPWSLYRSRYELRDYPRFLLKRNVRLYPPYLASIAISILATNFVLVPVFHIPHMTVTGRDLLLHFAYLNDLAHVPWVNVAYWTLAIEFQWYLLIGLVLPLLASRRRLARFAATSVMVLAYFAFPWDRLVFHFLPVFLIGVFVFQYRAAVTGLGEMLGLIAVMVFAMLRSSGWLVPLVAVPTGMLIAFPVLQGRAIHRGPERGPERSLGSTPIRANPARIGGPGGWRDGVADRVGDVSYSLYLLHLPIGVSVIGCLSHWLPYSGSYIGLLDVVGVAASMWAAWIMYRVIERPSQQISSAIRFVRRRPELPAQPSLAGAGD